MCTVVISCSNISTGQNECKWAYIYHIDEEGAHFYFFLTFDIHRTSFSASIKLTKLSTN
jgi:hypothetical protein